MNDVSKLQARPYNSVLPPSSRTALHLWFPNLFEFKGGIQVYLTDLLLVLTREFPHFHVTVHDKLDRSQPSKWNLKQLSFTFYGETPDSLRTLHFALGLAIDLLRNRPDLVLCGHLNFAPVAYWMHRFMGVPYWILVYGVDAWEVNSAVKQRALHTAAKVISISNYTRDRLIREQNLQPDRVSLLPVTFDASRFQIASKPGYLLERYGLTSQQPLILTVTRLSCADGYKGYDQVIQALLQIRQSLPQAHYLLVGKGDDQARIEQLIQHLGLQRQVTLAGFVADEELNDHYNLCDVFAMPSQGEGFGIVYLEALACGKPTLGGNQDGALDALGQGELGVLVDPDDTEAIAQSLIQILQGNYPHPLLYQPQKLRQEVIERFGFAQFQHTLAQLIQTAGLADPTPLKGG